VKGGASAPGRVAAWLAVGLLACLHFLLRPILTSWWIAPDLLVASLLVGTLHLRAGRAAVLGFSLGALEGWMALAGAAPLSVLFAVAGYVGVRAWDLFFADVGFFLPLYLLTGAWALTMASAWLTSATMGADFVLLRAGGSALLTAVICLPLERLVPSAYR
jgi:hypothetical protein